MRPGKPMLAGKNNNAIFVGLPGNPVSALICAHLFKTTCWENAWNKRIEQY